MFVYFVYYRCSGCEAVLQGIETQITKANQNKESSIRQRTRMEQEVTAYIVKDGLSLKIIYSSVLHSHTVLMKLCPWEDIDN